MKSTFRLFRVAGIDVGVHVSWLVIFALISWSLATVYFPGSVSGLDDLTAWILGATATVLLFASVLLHELAHSLMARARGLDARSITLFIFGGVSNLSGDAPRPATEFLIAVVGPLTSFVLGGLALGAVALTPQEGPLAALLFYLGVVNVLLGAFNLIPGFPLDGGRVLRAIAWQVTGSRRRGLEIAVLAGRFVSYGLMILGLVRTLGGDLLGGLFTIAIGWFLGTAASETLEQERLERRLQGLRVRDVMTADDTSIDPTETVAALVDEYLVPGIRRAMPVVSEGRLVGMVAIGDVQPVPAAARPTTLVGDIMGGRDGVLVATPEMSVAEAIDLLTSGDHEQLPVLEDGRLVGRLSRADVIRALQIRDALEGGGKARR